MARTKQTAKKTTGGRAPRVTLVVRTPRDSQLVSSKISKLEHTTPTGKVQAFLTNRLDPGPSDHGGQPPAYETTQIVLSELNNPMPAQLFATSRTDGSTTRPHLQALHSLGPLEGSCDGNNDFCHMCADGGDLWRCSVCVRSACWKCVEVPADSLPVVQHKDVKYLCVSCHISDNNKANVVIPYMAFYRDKLPVFARPLRISGRLELSLGSIIDAPVTAIIHFRLKDHVPTKGLANILHDFLRPYVVHSGALVMTDMPFDLGTETKVNTFLKKAATIAKKVSTACPSRVIFILSTHTDEDRGDLFTGVRDGQLISATIQELFEILFDPFKSISQNAILYALSCGGYVRHSNSRTEFTKAITKFGISATLAFDARRFHPNVAWTFLVTLTELVIIQGHTFEEAVPVALDNSNDLQRHSGVYLFLLSPDHNFVSTTRYLWADIDHRPWGKDVPIQCPSCGAAQEKWKRISTSEGYRYQCTNTDCVGDGRQYPQGPYYFDVKKLKRVVFIGNSLTAAWTKKHLRRVYVGPSS